MNEFRTGWQAFWQWLRFTPMSFLGWYSGYLTMMAICGVLDGLLTLWRNR